MERKYNYVLPYTVEEIAPIINISVYKLKKIQKELEKKGYLIRDVMIIDGKEKEITRYANNLFN